MALREVFAKARTHNQATLAAADLKAWISWAKRAARGFRTAAHFINIAYLRLSKLTHLPAPPFAPAMPR